MTVIRSDISLLEKPNRSLELHVSGRSSLPLLLWLLSKSNITERLGCVHERPC